MKKTLPFLLLLVFASGSFAQQKPQYTQYILNNYILNPALSGIENYTDVKMSMRNQWVGLNGAPKTVYFSAHGPIGKKDYKTSATSFNVPGQNPRGEAYWENYEASEAHHGIGMSLTNDQSGLYSRFNADISYAYHLGLSPKTNISAGFSAGINKVSYNRSKANAADPNDPALSAAGDLYKITPDLNAGIWIYSSDYFVGLAAQQIIPQKISFNTTAPGIKMLPHLFGTFGYRFLLNEDLNAIPSVMIKYVPGTSVPAQFDLNVKVQYRDLLWMGASYRNQDGYAAMLGANVGNTFNIGYSYDLTTTHLNTVSHGTHEFIIGILIGNRYSSKCPANMW
jgi:type IX secretion system PorP/SprF family membrane protein